MAWVAGCDVANRSLNARETCPSQSPGNHPIAGQDRGEPGMSDDTPGAPTRRRLLQAMGASVLTGLAGCETDDGGVDTPRTPDDDGGDDGDGTGGNGGGGGDDGTGDGEDDETDEPSDGSETDVSFDVDARRNPFFDTHEAFETFRINFGGFELRPVDGDPFRVEADGPAFDLTTLSADDGIDLLETGIPAGTYSEMAVHLPVVEATMADGGGSATVRNADPHVLDLGIDGEYAVDPGESVAFTLLVAVRESDTTWSYTLGYENY